MRKVLDISDFVDVRTARAVTADLTARFRLRRKEFGMSQKKLAVRSGVSYASIRRFESTGKISLSSLIKLAHAIICLEDFDNLFTTPIFKDLRD